MVTDLGSRASAWTGSLSPPLCHELCIRPPNLLLRLRSARSCSVSIRVIRCPPLFLPNVSVGHQLQGFHISVPNTLRHSLRFLLLRPWLDFQRYLIFEFKARLCWPSILTNLSSQQQLLNPPKCRAYQPFSRAFSSWRLSQLPHPLTFTLARRPLPLQLLPQLLLRPLLRLQEHPLHPQRPQH